VNTFHNSFLKQPKEESKGCKQTWGRNRKVEKLCMNKKISSPLSTHKEQITANMNSQSTIDCQWKRIGRVPQNALAEKHGLLTQHTN
jgi:ribosome biogenesis protein Tsr3